MKSRIIEKRFFFVSTTVRFFLLLLLLASSLPSRGVNTAGKQEVPPTTTTAPTQATNVTSDCKNTSSLWDDYVCELLEEQGDDNIQQRCMPRYILTGRIRPKGMIVAFHAFLECPDSFDELADAWVAAGYNVMIPLMVGHGRQHRQPDDEECSADNNSESAQNDSTKCEQQQQQQQHGSRLINDDHLPLTRQGYIDYANKINAIVQQEKETRHPHKIFATGISHGATMAIYVVNTARTHHLMYTRYLIMNPYFGFSSPKADFHFYHECLKTDNNKLSSKECIEILTKQEKFVSSTTNYDVGLTPSEAFLDVVRFKVNEHLKQNDDYKGEDYVTLNAIIRRSMTRLSEDFDSLPSGPLKSQLNDSILGWEYNDDNQSCTTTTTEGEFCGSTTSFRLRHLFAIHSFTQYVVRLSGRYDSGRIPGFYITTDRDGIIRNSLTIQVNQNMGRWKDGNFFLTKNSCIMRRFIFRQPDNFCIYQSIPNCTTTTTGNNNNTCGVPHSMISQRGKSLQSAQPPFDPYWMPSLIGNTTRYFDTGKTDFSSSNQCLTTTTLSSFETKPGDCVHVNIGNPLLQEGLLLSPFRGMWLRFLLVAGGQTTTPIKAKVENDIVMNLSKFLRLDKQQQQQQQQQQNDIIFIPTDKEIIQSSTTHYDDDDNDCSRFLDEDETATTTTATTSIQELYLEFPSDMITTTKQMRQLENAIIRNGLLDSTTTKTGGQQQQLLLLQVVEIEIAGRIPRRRRRVC